VGTLYVGTSTISGAQNIGGDSNVGGNISASGTLTVYGTSTLATTTISNLTVTGTSTVADIVPSADVTYTLGTNLKRFLNLFAQNIFASTSVITSGSSTNFFATNRNLHLRSASLYKIAFMLLLLSK
jgi:hypothetical protein